MASPSPRQSRGKQPPRKDGVRCDGRIKEGRRKGEVCDALLLAKDSSEAPLTMHCPRPKTVCGKPHSILVLLSKAVERGDISEEEVLAFLDSDQELTEEDMSQERNEKPEESTTPRRTHSRVSHEEMLKPAFFARLGSADDEDGLGGNKPTEAKTAFSFLLRGLKKERKPRLQARLDALIKIFLEAVVDMPISEIYARSRNCHFCDGLALQINKGPSYFTGDSLYARVDTSRPCAVIMEWESPKSTLVCDVYLCFSCGRIMIINYKD